MNCNILKILGQFSSPHLYLQSCIAYISRCSTDYISNHISIRIQLAKSNLARLFRNHCQSILYFVRFSDWWKETGSMHLIRRPSGNYCCTWDAVERELNRSSLRGVVSSNGFYNCRSCFHRALMHLTLIL